MQEISITPEEGYEWYDIKREKSRDNLDMATLITDAILNEFEKNGKVNIPLDEHKYSFDLQDVIQLALEKIANEDMINDNTKSIGE